MAKFTIHQFSFILFIFLAGISAINGQDDVYSIGAGIADTTGPVAEGIIFLILLLVLYKLIIFLKKYS